MEKFNYKEAFKRNIGLLTEEEQNKLKEFVIAIPGMGGVGGSHLIALVRQGFTKFKIADMDEFEVKNFNRQIGATMKTLGQDKAEVMKQRALEINPECEIKVYNKGITSENLDDFLEGVDLSIDGLDFFEVDIRRKFYNASIKKNLFLITAGPIGFSVAGFIIDPKSKYNFDSYFDVDDSTSYDDKIIHFAAGLAPSMLQRKYMTKVSLKEKVGPSSIVGVCLANGFVVGNTLRILLGWGDLKALPYHHQYDVRRNKFVCKKVYFGNKNPLQKLKIAIARKMLTEND
jgi:molybdopterin/thiamine biosynthesis adenylyltransferase